MTKEERKEYKRKYRIEHAEEIKEYQRLYRLEHSEELKEYGKQYRIEHSEELKEYRKQYRIEHADEVKETVKKWAINNADKIKQYRLDHADEIKEYSKDYYIENADKYKEYQKQRRNTKEGRAYQLLCAYNQKDKLRGFDTSDNITPEWIVENIFSGQKCVYCGEPDWTKLGTDRIDNKKPHTPDNVVCCCGDCNVKRNKHYTFEEFKEKKAKQ